MTEIIFQLLDIEDIEHNDCLLYRTIIFKPYNTEGRGVTVRKRGKTLIWFT